MGLFNWNKKKTPEPEIIVPTVPVEIVANKHARKEVIEKAQKAQEELNRLLVENHFTIKIMVAAGANPGSPKKKAK